MNSSDFDITQDLERDKPSGVCFIGEEGYTDSLRVEAYLLYAILEQLESINENTSGANSLTAI